MRMGNYKFCTANRLYGKTGVPFNQSFVHELASFYGSTIEAVDDFTSPAATKSINDWVSEQTEGKITDLLAPGSMNPDTQLVLVNALYFKGRWHETFSPKNTKKDVFKVTWPQSNEVC